MRIERTGKISPLTPRFRRFLAEALKGTDLDDIQSPTERRADFSCLGGLMAIELKSLEEDGSERIGNLTSELRQREDWPHFLGSAPLDSFLKNLSDAEQVRRRLVDRIGRNLHNHLKTANGQLAAHALSYPRKNLVRLVVFVNEDHALYDPQVVTYALSKDLASQRADGSLRLESIDAALFLTERHGSMMEGQVAFPVVAVEGPQMADQPWKGAVVDHLCKGWAAWNGHALFGRGERPPPQFSTIEPIPEQMRRSEAWALGYRRNPYMRNWSIEQLRDRFDEIICVTTFSFVHGCPVRPPPPIIHRAMQHMSEMMVEMADRAIPVTEFPQSSERILAAARRLRAPPNVIEWLKQFERRRSGQGVRA